MAASASATGKNLPPQIDPKVLAGKKALEAAENATQKRLNEMQTKNGQEALANAEKQTQRRLADPHLENNTNSVREIALFCKTHNIDISNLTTKGIDPPDTPPDCCTIL